MKKKGIILMAVLGSVLLLASCGLNSGGVSENGGRPVNAQQNYNNQAEEEDATKDESAESIQGEVSESDVAEEEQEKQEAETIYKIGESAALKDWEISVTDMQIVESIAADYGTFSPNESGNRYVQVFVTATNNGKQAGRFLPTIGIGDDVSAKIFFGDGYEFSATNLLGYSKEMHDTTVNPLSSQTGEIAFEVPEAVYASEDELQIHFISGNDAVKFKIR